MFKDNQITHNRVLITILTNTANAKLATILNNCCKSLNSSILQAKAVYSNLAFEINLVESADLKINKSIYDTAELFDLSLIDKIRILDYSIFDQTGSFNYNRAINYSLYNSKPFDYHFICNNDLVFDEITILNMLKTFELDQRIISVCPKTANWHQHDNIISKQSYLEGYRRGVEFTGWLNCLDKRFYQFYPTHDELFDYYRQDDDIVKTIESLHKKSCFKNVLALNVGNFIHLLSQSQELINYKEKMKSATSNWNSKYSK